MHELLVNACEPFVRQRLTPAEPEEEKKDPLRNMWPEDLLKEISEHPAVVRKTAEDRLAVFLTEKGCSKKGTSWFDPKGRVLGVTVTFAYQEYERLLQQDQACERDSNESSSSCSTSSSSSKSSVKKNERDSVSEEVIQNQNGKSGSTQNIGRTILDYEDEISHPRAAGNSVRDFEEEIKREHTKKLSTGHQEIMSLIDTHLPSPIENDLEYTPPAQVDLSAELAELNAKSKQEYRKAFGPQPIQKEFSPSNDFGIDRAEHIHHPLPNVDYDTIQRASHIYHKTNHILEVHSEGWWKGQQVVRGFYPVKRGFKVPLHPCETREEAQRISDVYWDEEE